MRRFCLAMMLIAFVATQLPAATVTSTADSGLGSLRTAILNAASGETITFAVTGVVTLTSGQLEISKALKIAGPGAEQLAIQRNSSAPPFRIFNVFSVNAAISGLTIRNGACDLHADSGAGIQNYGTLALTDCVLEDNVATDRGGGIYNAWQSSLLVSNCVFRRNTSTGDYGEGGGIYIFGNATILNSSFLNNGVHDRGGGLQVDSFGAAVVNGSTFFANTAIGAEGQGGGIYNYGWLAMTNCTLSGNRVNENGGGLHNDQLAPALFISSCTFYSNAAVTGGAIFLNGGFGLRFQTNRIHNSIISGNGFDFYAGGDFVSDGFNIVGYSGGFHLPVWQPSDRLNVFAGDLHLGPLQNNGGLTRTHALLPGSVAFETGDDAHCPAMDQRGVARPHYAHCDVGAFEVNNLSPSIQCVSTNIECTSSNGAVATISVTVSDPDGDALVVIWGGLGAEFQTNFVSAGAPNTPIVLLATRQFSPVLNYVPVLVFDGITESMNCLSVVNVQDTTPPTIDSVIANPDVLTPATHKFVPVTVQVNATDACGPVTSRIIFITSSDPVNGRQADWEITGPLTVNLRAEHSSPKTARVYTISVESRDGAGNVSTAAVTVTVPVHKP